MAAIEGSGRSMRSISLEAGLSPGYLHTMMTEEKDPTVSSLQAIGQVLGVSVSELLDGHPVAPETEELLVIWSALPAERRRALLDLLRTQKSTTKK